MSLQCKMAHSHNSGGLVVARKRCCKLALKSVGWEASCFAWSAPHRARWCLEAANSQGTRLTMTYLKNGATSLNISAGMIAMDGSADSDLRLESNSIGIVRACDPLPLVCAARIA